MEQESMERNEQTPERNLKTQPAATIEAMAQVEGPGWLELQQKLQAMSQGERDKSSEYAVSVQKALNNLEKGKRTTVYGSDANSRWYVAPDGKVSFSKLQARLHKESEKIQGRLEKVQELGFEISEL